MPTSFVYRIERLEERQSKQPNKLPHLAHCPFPCDTRVLHASTQLMLIPTGKGSNSSMVLRKVPLSPCASFIASSATSSRKTLNEAGVR